MGRISFRPLASVSGTLRTDTPNAMSWQQRALRRGYERVALSLSSRPSAHSERTPGAHMLHRPCVRTRFIVEKFQTSVTPTRSTLTGWRNTLRFGISTHCILGGQLGGGRGRSVDGREEGRAHATSDGGGRTRDLGRGRAHSTSDVGGRECRWPREPRAQTERRRPQV